jgi:hypothetical protein
VFAVLRGLCVCAAVPFKQRNCMFTFLNRKICVFTILNINLNTHCNVCEHSEKVIVIIKTLKKFIILLFFLEKAQILHT